MQKSTEPLRPEQIVEIIIKRRWLIIIPFCLSILVGIYLALTLPKSYSAETLILIEPQRVPANYVQSIVSIDIESRISTISQQIMSRTNLEKIINQFDFFSGPKFEKMYLEDKIESLRKQISVDVTRGRRRDADSFSISFIGKNPKIVMQVVNSLTSFFIDENLKVREAQAIGTSDFLNDELNDMRKKLEKVEEVLKIYKEKHMGELPEQLETNLRILDRLQERFNERQQSLRDEKNRLAILENQIQLAKAQADSGGTLQSTTLDPSGLEGLKRQVYELKTKYTDKHPDVIRLEKRIANLEEEKQTSSGESTHVTQLAQAETETPASNVEYIRQYEEVKREIKAQEAKISKLSSQIDFYQKRVERTPKREQELLSLRRDYNNMQMAYNSLLNRKLEAEIAVNMEKKQKGEQFRIVDYATLPQKPVSPNMKKLFLLALAAGLGIGAGIIFFLEYLDTSFTKPEDIESFLGVPVIATVPKIYQPKDIRWQRINLVFSVFFIMVSFTLLTGFAVLTFKGVDQTMEFVNRFIH
jgi:polysaccharide chain length determinant protein (PEP-CTERM system associated)